MRFNRGIYNFFSPLPPSSKTTNSHLIVMYTSKSMATSLEFQSRSLRRQYWFLSEMKLKVKEIWHSCSISHCSFFIFILFPSNHPQIVDISSSYVPHSLLSTIHSIANNKCGIILCVREEFKSVFELRLKERSKIYHSLPTFEASDYHFLNSAWRKFFFLAFIEITLNEIKIFLNRTFLI